MRNRVYNYLAHYRFKRMGVHQIFETIYNENHWGDGQSRSGTGSNIQNTEKVVEIVTQIITSLKINTMLDIPCGDFNWMKRVELTNVNYVGCDIVDKVVSLNQEKYSTETINFRTQNILEPLTKVDLIFVRDCLVHFSYDHIKLAIESIKKSGSTYLATTSFPMHNNHDIITGDWRPVNLQSAPFNFPTPLFIHRENCLEDERYADKSLAVWKISDL